MKVSEVQSIIAENQQNIAFLVGNGINRHFNEGVHSWQELLIELWGKFLNSMTALTIPPGISMTEFYDVFQLKLGRETNMDNEIQKSVKDIIMKWNGAESQKILIKKIQSLEAPLLTSNFDHLLSDSMGLKFNKMDVSKFTDFYPWSCYFSDRQLSSPLEGFGIWHVNGMAHYHRSIKLGLSHYMANVSRVKGFIQSDLSKHDINDHRGSNFLNSWLNIIFNKSLFIVGLSLEENEVFMRWLLIERAKYFHHFYDKTQKGWYVIKKGENNISDGKKFFLESVGFEIIELDDYESIYERIWEF